MADLTPRQSERPLVWSDTVLDLADLLSAESTPVYIVGGAVRDALLRRPIKDVDITTPESGLKLAQKIANRLGGDYFPLDAEREVGRALVDSPEGRLMIDVARFRGDDLYADLLDRDFTVNAMAVDLRDVSLLIDPLDGEHDTYNKIIRRCNPQSISHDPIRALRAVRQSIQLGMRIEPETLANIREFGGRIVDTSPERVRDEFFKMLALPKAASALRILDTLGLLTLIVPEVKPLHGLTQDPPQVFDAWGHTLLVVEQVVNVLTTISPARTDSTAAQFSLGMMVMALDRYRGRLQEHILTPWADGRSHQALLVLAALLHDAGKASTADSTPRFDGHAEASAVRAEARAAALRLSGAERARLTAVVRHHPRPHHLDDLSPRAVHRFWRALGDSGVDVCLLALADYLGMVGAELVQDDWLRFVERIGVLLDAYFQRYDELVDPPPLLDGTTLMAALGLKPGRKIGVLLDLIREAQAAGEVRTADDALNLAREFLHPGS